MSVKQDFAPLTRVTAAPKARPRLRTRLTIAFVVFNLLTLLAFIAVVSLFVLRPYLRQEIRARHQDAVSLAALSIDTDTVAQLVEAEPGPSATLDSVIAQLRVARDRISGARFAYLMRQGADGRIYFVADAEEVPEDAAAPGSVYEDASSLLQQSIGTLTEVVVEQEFYEDQWGVWLSGYAPIRTTDGTLIAVLGVDLEATDVRRRELAFLQVGVIALLVAAPLTLLVGLALGRRLTAHLGTLVSAVERVRAGDLNYEAPLPEEEESAQLATAFNEMTRRLRETVSGLEERVTARTRDLERQATYLRATGEVSRVAASIFDLDELLAQVAALISAQFGFYHAGIFLLDETREWAVLRAASSEGGQRMVARGHRLGVGAQGIVGYVTQTGRPRIALDVGDDMVWFNNPDLPETHSEMALPLIVGERVIGALDVQSQETGAFKNEDINTLRILADQLAIAIANALVFSQRQQAIEELQRAYSTDTRRSWLGFMAQLGLRGYRYTPRTLEALGQVEGPDHAVTGLTHPQVSADNTLFLPLTFSGLELGVLQIRRPVTRPWVEEEIMFASRAVQELAQALESARLYQNSQRQAAREQLTGEITARMRETLDVETMLRTVLREVSDVLGLAEAEVRFRAGPEITIPTGEEVAA